MKRKQPAESATSERPRAARFERAPQAFSYYVSRRASTPEGASVPGQRARFSEDPAKQAAIPRRKSHPTLFWGGMLLVGFFVVQLTMLGTKASVACQVNGKRTTACDAQAYEATASRALGRSLLNRNKVTIDTQAVVKDVKTAHPEIEEAVVAVPLVGTKPTLLVQISAPAYTLAVGPSRYTLSESGYVSAATAAPDGALEVRDETGETVSVSNALLPSSHVKFMQRIQFQMEQAHYHIEYFLLPRGKTYELDMKLKGKPYTVKFNFQEDPLRQSGALLSVLRTLGATEPGQHIDVRVPGRAYYK